ncbi:MAG: hypothetical protein ACI8XD_001285, partial [Thermoproteota archaeon]
RTQADQPGRYRHGRVTVRGLGKSDRVALIECGEQSWVAKEAGGPRSSEGH